MSVKISRRKGLRKAPALSPAEDALRIAKERFELAAAAVDSAIYDWNIQEETVTWTDGIQKVFGYTPDQVQNADQWWIDRIHRDDRQRVLDQISVELEKARDYAVEYRFAAADGQYRAVLDRGLLVRNDSGRVIRVVGSIADITERKLAEETLHLLIELIATASESDDIETMTSSCLEKICTMKGWQLGQAWFVDTRENELFCSHSFYSEIDLTEFRGESLLVRLGRGTDLPGIVWETLTSRWVQDVETDPSFLRASAAAGIGLKTGIAFPVQQGGNLLAIFEFFTTQSRPPDQHFLRVTEKLGSHLAAVFERKQEQEKLRHQAYHDVLTGVPNRFLFQDRFLQALAHARRNRSMLAVLFLDLDRFKAINDTLGHSTGDQFLKEVAQRLEGSLREVDTVARMGGDEFIILLSDIEQIEDAAKVAKKVLSLFSTPFTIEKQQLFTTTSIGISIFPHDGEDSQVLLKSADIALYRAKEKGRNNYQLYTPEMTDTAQTRFRIEDDLQRGLASKEFILHYQPLLCLRTGKIFAVEALLRWRHPEIGVLLPAEFLPVAEDTGIIRPLWIWSLETACMHARTWQKTVSNPPHLSMNVPSLLFQQPDLAQIVEDALKETHLQPELLHLEVPESLLSHATQSEAVLRQLKSLGIKTTIDDYGVGFSSLSHLRNLPIDAIKIDPYFVRDLPYDPKDVAVVSSIIALGHGLNALVIAESVEQQAQLDCLRSLGCDAIQGFLFSRPLLPETLIPLLSKEFSLGA